MKISACNLPDGSVAYRNAEGVLIPRYGFRDSPYPPGQALPGDCPAGLYLCLFHGRWSADENPEDWGFDGPAFGPLRYVHTTYATHVKFDFIEDDRALFYGYVPGGLIDLRVEGIDRDLLACAGVYFGDWTVFNHLPASP